MNTVEMTLEKEIAGKVLEALEPEHWMEDERFIRIRMKKIAGRKLCSVIFSKSALRKLFSDPDREIKLDYLRRDIARQARARREYRYPRQFAFDMA